MFAIIKTLLLVVLSASAVLSILDPSYTEKTRTYRLDPYIARELQRTNHHEGIPSHRSGSNPRLSSNSRYQETSSSSSISTSIDQQQERHANHDRKDYANNLDENYTGCPSGYTGLLPYPYDCRRFVNCWKGRAYIQTCGPGTVFNGDTLECDNPNKVVCRGLSAKLFDQEKQKQQPSTNNRIGRLQSYNDDGGDDNEEVSCPRGHTGLLPHPHDCSKFLNCASGVMHIQSCGPRTMFEPRMKVCDFATKVDCTGRWGGSPSASSSSTDATPSHELWGGNRGGKKFELTTSQNQPSQPQRKGWQFNHNHNHHHHPHHHDHGFHQGSGAIFSHHHHNCTNRAHNHRQFQQPTTTPQTPSPAFDQETPLIYRNRWVSMNRTRPSAPTTPANIPNTSWSPSNWKPIQPEPDSSKSFWYNRGSPGQPTTPRTPSPPPTTTPPSNYPNVFYGSTLPPGTDTTIFYAQPVYDDEPSEEVFNNVVGADVSQISLPSNRRNYSRDAFTPEPDPSMDTINIPNINLMPPHRTFPPDDRQFHSPDQDSVFPKPTQPSIQRPFTASGGRNPPPSPDYGSIDAISIPNQNLMPPHIDPPTDHDDRQSEVPEEFSPAPPKNPNWPNFNLPSVHDIDLRNGFQIPETTTNIPTWEDTQPDYSGNYPSFTLTNSRASPKPESRDQFSYGSSWTPQSSFTPRQDPTPSSVENPWLRIDESNLYGGMLPPPLPDSDPRSTLPPFSIEPSSPPNTTPPPNLQTNVRVFQIYPPPEVQNATTKLHPNPFYSPSYSGVAHSRNTTWPSIKTSPPNRNTSPRPFTKTTTPTPDIVFSHDGGVVVASHHISPSPPATTTQRHGLSPPDYNREYYKPTTPMSAQRTASSQIASDNNNDQTDLEQMPISEAIKLLLRPYINRSGTVTDDMVSNAESHIMNLSHSIDSSPSTATKKTTPTTTTPTTTTTPDPLDKDVEIVFAGEQNSLSSTYVPPPPLQSSNHHQHSYHQQENSPSKYHERHDRHFHQMHPHMPNPFGNELGPGDYENSDRDASGIRTTPTATTTIAEETSPEVDNQLGSDVCEFDCGNGQCVKTFETCNGINNCGNKKDEEQCSHLGYEIRLSNQGYGRVEVKILGQWGYVCDDKFGILDANVVCRELGYQLGASEVHGNSFYPPADNGEVSFVMDEVDCTGNETSLKDCHFKGWGVSDCGPDEVVGVQCKTPVMTCPNDYWLCKSSKECIPPAFVCDNVPDCSDKSDESAAVCNSTVEFRLRDGTLKNEGRLEVLYRGVWGTVCDDDFGQTEAQVACNTLGYYGPAKIVKNAFGPGSGPIWLDQLSCFGNETTLDTCNHWSWGEHNCNHTEDVSIKCTPGVAPRPTKPSKTTNHPSSAEDLQTDIDDIGLDLYPMERSSKFVNSRKICGHFNPNLTDEIPRELERVVKGTIAKRGHHPWQATIRTKGRGGISSHWCGAVLISKKHLLTAAHCLVGYPKGAYFIRLGDHYANIAESSEIDSFIENWYIHEKFRDGAHMNNDIAVIVMKNPVRFNDYIQPICLPPEGTVYKEDRRCTISGWGSIQSGVSTPSNNLRFAEIPMISDEICKLPHVYGSSITEGMFCAGFLDEGVDACEGDSGGPFVCSDSGAETLYGIISWGQQCGHANKPGVYVKVEKYLDWIYEKIRFSMQKPD